MHHVTTLYRSTSVRIIDYRCKAERGACGAEEAARGWDIAFVRSGLFVRHVGGRRVVGDPNQVLFFNRDEPYRVSHPAERGDECTVISLSPEVLGDIAESVDLRAANRRGPHFQATHAPTTPDSDLLHRRLFHATRRGPLEALAVEEISLGLVAHVMRVAHRRAGGHVERIRGARRRHRAVVEDAKQVLAAGFREPLGVEDLASRVGSSPFHLCRIFRHETGMPIHQYQMRLRVRAALERIAGGEQNLAALAVELGFCDQAHFSNTFRRALGFPPSRSREGVPLTALLKASKNLQA